MDESRPQEHSIETYGERVRAFLSQFVSRGVFNLRFTIRKNDLPKDGPAAPECVVEFDGPDADLLIEKNGALLDALEYISLKAIRLDEELFRRISFDCHDWRRLRIEELKLTAQIAAERVIETGEPFALNPMNPRERRVVHLALRDNPSIRTASEGMGSERRVIIHPTTPPFRRRR